MGRPGGKLVDRCYQYVVGDLQGLEFSETILCSNRWLVFWDRTSRGRRRALLLSIRSSW